MFSRRCPGEPEKFEVTSNSPTFRVFLIRSADKDRPFNDDYGVSSGTKLALQLDSTRVRGTLWLCCARKTLGGLLAN
jgi:hypothetical protein